MSDTTNQIHNEYFSRIMPRDVENYLYKNIFLPIKKRSCFEGLVGMRTVQTKLKNWIVTRREPVSDAHVFIFLKEYGITFLRLCDPMEVIPVLGCITQVVKDYKDAKLLPRNKEYLAKNFMEKHIIIYKNNKYGCKVPVEDQMIGKTMEDSFKHKCFSKFREYDMKVFISREHIFMCNNFDNPELQQVFMISYVKSHYIDKKYFGEMNGKEKLFKNHLC